MAEMNGWVLHERLGAGGMGVVYRGTRGQAEAAIKVIHPALAADETFRRRFKREVEVARLVTSAHAAHVVDFEVDEAQWLATELLAGPLLSELIEGDGPLAGEQLDHLAEGTARGLIDLHRAGVVHRDLKPANIVMTSRGPVLIDFGIAAAAELTSVTTVGSSVGSKGWMSPEQATGAAVSTASDIFNFGLLIAFAATGRHPFGTGSAEALLYRLTHENPDLRGLPARWSQIVSDCLSVDPSGRPTATSVLERHREAESESYATPDPHRSVTTEPIPDELRTTVEVGPLASSDVTRAESIASRIPNRRPRSKLFYLAMVVPLLMSAAGASFYFDYRTRTNVAAGASPQEASPTATVSTTEPSTPPATQPTASTGPIAAAFAGPAFDGSVFPNTLQRKRAFRRFVLAHRGQLVRIDATIPAQGDLNSCGSTFEWIETSMWGGAEGDVNPAADGHTYLCYAHGSYDFGGYFTIDSALQQNQNVVSMEFTAVTPTAALGLPGSGAPSVTQPASIESVDWQNLRHVPLEIGGGRFSGGISDHGAYTVTLEEPARYLNLPAGPVAFLTMQQQYRHGASMTGHFIYGLDDHGKPQLLAEALFELSKYSDHHDISVEALPQGSAEWPDLKVTGTFDGLPGCAALRDFGGYSIQETGRRVVAYEVERSSACRGYPHIEVPMNAD